MTAYGDVVLLLWARRAAAPSYERLEPLVHFLDAVGLLVGAIVRFREISGEVIKLRFRRGDEFPRSDPQTGDAVGGTTDSCLSNGLVLAEQNR